jgi:hypothetical protein
MNDPLLHLIFASCRLFFFKDFIHFLHIHGFIENPIDILFTFYLNFMLAFIFLDIIKLLKYSFLKPL